MKALLGYSYEHGKWEIHTVFENDFFVLSPYQIKRNLTDEGRYLYPEWFFAEIKSYCVSDGVYSAEIFDDVVFPKVLSLEQSIQKNKSILLALTQR